MARLRRLVIHCTATPAGREVSKHDIIRWHIHGNGWSKVGYHDLIHLDGSIENLIPYDEDDQVQPWEISNGAAGFNSSSRHVVYAGGCDSNMNPKDTRTPQQWAALQAYVKEFMAKHPDCEVVGHNQLNPRKACPSFSVPLWLKEIL